MRERKISLYIIISKYAETPALHIWENVKTLDHIQSYTLVPLYVEAALPWPSSLGCDLGIGWETVRTTLTVLKVNKLHETNMFIKVEML